jgi:hypothetical protein
MIDLGSTEFYIKAEGLPSEEFEAYSSRLFDLWEARVAEELNLEDYSLTLEIEEGSIKGSGKIKTGLKVVFYAVCGYGSLVQGLQYIGSHVSGVGDFLSAMAHEALGPEKPAPIVRKKSGTIGQLQRLFVKVHRREMSVEEAIGKATELIGDDAVESPEFMERLTQSLRNTQLHPEQTALPLDGVEEPHPMERNDQKTPRPTKPSPPIPPGNQVRVEVWKESKRGKKKIRVTNIQ